MSEAERLAAWCEEKAREFERKAYERDPTGDRYEMNDVRYNREAEEAADNLKAIAVLLRDMNAGGRMRAS